MSLPDFPNHTDLICKYGDPFVRWGKSSFRINTVFLAGLFLKLNEIRYFYDTGTFMLYTGRGWTEVHEDNLLNMIEDLISCVSSEYDIPSAGMITNGVLQDTLKTIRRKVSRECFPKLGENVLPCANVFLTWDNESHEFQVGEYAPDVLIKDKFSVTYDPGAQASEFLRILEEIIPDQEDRRVVQEVMGAWLFPVNRSRKILVLYGEGGSGKSILVNIVREILTASRCFPFNLGAAARDYEFASLTTETLLIGSETGSEASKGDGPEMAKSLVGGDPIRRKRHGSNKKSDLEGYFSVVIVSNHTMQFPFEGQGNEWRFRLVPIAFMKSIKLEKDIAAVLLKKEGSGILNWLLDGARRVRRNEWMIELSTEQQARCEDLMVDKNPVEKFVRAYIQISAGHNLTSQEIFEFYNSVQGRHHWPSLAEKTFFHQLCNAMGRLHNNPGTKIRNGEGREVRGYHGVSILPSRARGLI